MSKYLNLYFTFFKTSVMADLEYRLNVVTRVFTDIIWYAAQASVFEVLFHHVPRISSWELPQARVFMAVLFLMDAIWMIMFQENFDRMSFKVRRGEMDLVLAKPVDAQFMMTMQKQNTPYVINIFITLAYLVWTTKGLPNPVEWWRFGLLLAIGAPVSLAIMYGFRLMFACLTIIYTNADGMTYVWYQIYRLGMRPDPLYPPWLRYLVLSLLPVGFIASVPAQILIGITSWWLIAAGVGLAIAVLTISRIIWKKSLVNYASASS